MKIETLERLQRLREKYGFGVFGKIAQKLLALAFWEIGATHVVERGVQGVDIDFDLPGDGGKYALEVKTTDGFDFALDSANLDALAERKKECRRPAIAALRLAPLEEWIISEMPLEEIVPGRVAIDRLRAHRMKDLEQTISPVFDRVVSEHFEGTMASGERYLKEQLKKKGVEVREKA